MTHHGAALHKLTKDQGLVDQLKSDYTRADVDDKTRAMLDYAVKLTTAVTQMTEHDIDALRDAGLDDREILDLCQVTAYFNYVNRMAEGLGVQLESYWE